MNQQPQPVDGPIMLSKHIPAQYNVVKGLDEE